MKNSRLLTLFDLDGTLVDPAGAITGGISAALRACGLRVPADRELQRMVGPSRVRSLKDIAGVPEDRLDEVIGLYRQDYRSTGMAASRPYPGIINVIGALRNQGHPVAVATQKPEWLALELLDVQGMTKLFHSVHGSPRDEREAAALQGKTTIIAAALAQHRGRFDAAVMVGDRSHDIAGAKANSLPCVAVTWGFGTIDELTAAGADAVVDRADQLPSAVSTAAAVAAKQAVAHGRL
ncbi:HAD hydrolase-like protein [Arthrobacter sp. H5]|uniref:HAD hydrolase-like protein n=1 Tax=Arthrobacter sp. H5 TaxID=1267973 RepID=UPI0004897DE2|nr:HAD hydrolase-like protein [Arthrobacter sp. H5]